MGPAGRSSITSSAIFRYGSYPESEHWRIDLTEAIGAVLIVWLLWRPFAEAEHRGGAVLHRLSRSSASSCCTAAAGSACRSSRHNLWGGVLVTLLVSLVGIVFSLPLGVLAGARAGARKLPARSGLLDRLHRIRARRALHHRAVHGQLHAADVPARRLDAGPSAAPAGRHRAVRGGLYGGGGARRPAGHAARPVRRRLGARPRLLEDHAARSSCRRR